MAHDVRQFQTCFVRLKGLLVDWRRFTTQGYNFVISGAILVHVDYHQVLVFFFVDSSLAILSG